MDLESLRNRLRPERIPAVPAIAAALALGIVVPFLVSAEHRPTEYTAAFARKRLESFQGAARALAPQGDIFSERPSFHWEEVPGATGYRFRLATEDGAELVAPTLVPRPPQLLRPPGRLEVGGSYRFSVEALGGGSPRSATFRRLQPPPALEGARRFVRGAEVHLVLAGIFAELGSSDDVASELDAYLDAAPAGEHAELALRVLARLGRGRPQA